MRYVLCVPVWGEFFRDIWERLVLPSYLAPGNLPFLAETDKIDVLIFTRNEDADWFARQPWLRRLAALAKVDVVPLPSELLTPGMHLPRGEPMQLKYSIHSHCVRHAIQKYRGESDVVLMTMYGDVVLTAGYCRTIAKAMAEGYHAVTGAGLSIDLDTARPALEARIAESATGAFGSEDIVRLALDHLHAGLLAQMWGSGVSTSNFSQFFWRVGGEGIVSHIFHPFAHAAHLGRLRPEAIDFRGSFDMQFLFDAVPDISNIHVIQDSTDGFLLEMSSTAYQRADLREQPWRAEALGAELGHFLGWGMLFDPATQAGIALTPFRFHHGAMSEAWGEVEAEAGALMRTVLDHVTLPVPQPA